MSDSNSTIEQLYELSQKELKYTKAQILDLERDLKDQRERNKEVRDRHKRCNQAYWDTKALFRKEEAEAARLRLELAKTKDAQDKLDDLRGRHMILHKNFDDLLKKRSEAEKSSKAWYKTWQTTVAELEHEKGGNIILKQENDELKKELNALREEFKEEEDSSSSWYHRWANTKFQLESTQEENGRLGEENVLLEEAVSELEGVQAELKETKRQLNNAWESNKRLREYDVTADHQMMIDVLNKVRSLLNNTELDDFMEYDDDYLGHPYLNLRLAKNVMNDVHDEVNKALDPDRPTNLVDTKQSFLEGQVRDLKDDIENVRSQMRLEKAGAWAIAKAHEQNVRFLEGDLQLTRNLLSSIYAQLLAEKALTHKLPRLDAITRMVEQIEEYRRAYGISE